jgi:hypothetical protein
VFLAIGAELRAEHDEQTVAAGTVQDAARLEADHGYQPGILKLNSCDQGARSLIC